MAERTSARSGFITCIVNGAAGSNRARQASDRLADLFAQHGAQARLVLARHGDDIAALARRAVEENSRLVVAGGGDGTMNGVASALIGTETALGVVPLGTLNHFARDLNIPTALEAAVANIFAGQVVRVDVGEVNGRPFLNNSSLGLYPSIVREREDQQRKGYGKWVAFAEAVLFALRHYSPLYVSLRMGPHNQIADGTPFIFVGNNRYALSGLHIGERASLNAGKLWVYSAPHAGRIKLLRVALQAFAGVRTPGDLATFDTKEFWIGAKSGRLNVARDGELALLATPLHFRSRPGALHVIVPTGDRIPSSD